MFKFSVDPIQASQEEYSFDSLEMLQMRNDIVTTFEDLEDTFKKISAVQDLRTNMLESLELLADYGQSAVPQLNLDKGLETLMNVPEKLITAQKAVEALQNEYFASTESLRERLNDGWEKVKNFFKMIFEFMMKLLGGGAAQLKNLASKIRGKADAAKTNGAQKLVRKQLTKSTENLTLMSPTNFAQYKGKFLTRLQDLTWIASCLVQVQTSIGEIVTSKTEATRDYDEIVKQLSAILHTDASYLTKADDKLKEIENDDSIEASFEIDEMSIEEYKGVSESFDQLVSSFSEFGQKFGQLANFYKNQINETEKLKTEMFAANKENAFNFFMTAMYSIGRIYNRLSRTSTRCYRAMTAVGRTLDSFTEESSPKA